MAAKKSADSESVTTLNAIDIAHICLLTRVAICCTHSRLCELQVTSKHTKKKEFNIAIMN